MSGVKNNVAKALAYSITNDRFGRGVVSANDAKRILGAALEEIEKSEKPLDTFKDSKRFIEAAKDLLGRSRDAERTLESFSDVGMNAVHARLEALQGETLLPAAARAELEDYLDWTLDIDPENLEISNLKGDPEKGYSFQYSAEGKTGTAHMLNYGGAWLVSPVKLDQPLVDGAMDAARAYFDDVVVPMLNEYSSPSPERLAAMRAGLNPSHVVPGDDDYDKTDESFEEGWPFEMNINGGIGCDGGVYVSFKPEDGTFNAFGRYA